MSLPLPPCEPCPGAGTPAARAARVFQGWRARSRVAFTSLLCAVALVPSAARADDGKADPSISVAERVAKLERLISELGRQINALQVSYVGANLAPPQQELQTRLNDAQIAYQLKDYFQASIIFFDIVEDPRHRKDGSSHEEALYFLADSLYQNRNFLAARRYFSDLMSTFPRSRFYQDALTKVVSMALVTGRHDEVDTFYSRLVQNASGTIAPAIPYLYAKSLYRRKELDRAAAAFATVPQQSPYFIRARFYMGGILAAQGKFQDSVKAFYDIFRFDPLAGGAPADAAAQQLVAQNREIIEMTHVGLGRLYYDLGDLQRAAEAYQEVNRKSAQFPEALFELAWTWIKGKQYEKARRALELLMLSRVDSQTLPEAQVLLGDLQVLLDRKDDAAKTYQAVKATFEPIRQELSDHIAKHAADPVRYFNALLAGKLDRMDPSAMLPPVATRWVQTGERVSTAMQVVRDLNASRAQLKEARNIVMRLQAALEAKDKLEMFPLLRDGRASALELENRHLRAKLELTFLEGLLVSDQVAPNELAAVEVARNARKAVEQEFGTVPMTKEDYLKRREAQQQRVALLEGEVHKVGITVDGIKAQLVAAIKYWQDTRARRTVAPADEQAMFAKIEAEKAELRAIEQALDGLRRELVAARARAGVGDEAVVLDDAIRKRLSDALDHERTSMSPLRLRLSGARYDAVRRIEGLRSVVDRHIAALGGFRAQLAQMVTAKAEEFRQRIVREDKLLTLYEAELAEQDKQSEQVAGGVAYDTYKRVQKKFYDLVIGADRGLVEIVWREKDRRARRVQQLKSNRKVDLKQLDEEFQDVLREE